MRSSQRCARPRSFQCSLANDFFQNAKSCGLQRSGAPSGKEPDTLLFIGAVDDLHLIVCRGVIEGAATVLLKKLEECLAPWVVKGWKDFLSNSFQLFDADRFDRLLDRVSALIFNRFNVQVFGVHI